MILSIFLAGRVIASGNVLLIGGDAEYSNISDAVSDSALDRYDTLKFLSDYTLDSIEAGRIKDKNVIISDGVSLRLESGCTLQCRALYVSGSSDYPIVLRQSAKIVHTKIFKTDTAPQVIIGFAVSGGCCTGKASLDGVEFCSENTDFQLQNIYAFDSLSCGHFQSFPDQSFKDGILKFKPKVSEKEENSSIKQPDLESKEPEQNPGVDISSSESGDHLQEVSNELQVSNSKTRVYCDDVFYVDIKASKCSDYSMVLSYDSEIAKMIKAEFFGSGETEGIVDDISSLYSEVSGSITQFPDDSLICRFYFKAVREGVFNLQLKDCKIDGDENPMIKYGGAVTIVKQTDLSVDKESKNEQSSTGGSETSLPADKSDSSSSGSKDTENSDDSSKTEVIVEDNVSQEMNSKIERFTDLAGYEWCMEAVDILSDKGIIVGTDKDKFSPEKNTKRGDFMLVLSRILELSGGPEDSFYDVPTDSYYSGAISALKNLDIAKGSNGLFTPEGFITRQDMFCLIHRVMECFGLVNSSKSSFSLNKFSDADLISPYAVESIKYLVKNEIVSGDGNMINPLEYTNRAEIAVICSKLYDMYQSFK